jgi:hypothetical protein
LTDLIDTAGYDREVLWDGGGPERWIVTTKP